MGKQLTFGSLFAGCGGMDLGLERAGLKCKWQVEIDDYATKVLKARFPSVRRFRDVRDFPPAGDWRVDVITGGFPCQNLSTANVVSRVGLDGEKSGLWFEFLRIVDRLRPSAVVAENSWHNWRKWVPTVRRQLWDLGYSSLPMGIDSAAFGTKHRRRRAFVVAHSDSDRQSAFAKHAEVAVMSQTARRFEPNWRRPSPRALGVADGVPRRMDRLRCVGNAVHVDVAEWIGRRLIESTP